MALLLEFYYEPYKLNDLTYLNNYRIAGTKHRPSGLNFYIFEFLLNDEQVDFLQKKDFKFNCYSIENKKEKELLKLSLYLWDTEIKKTVDEFSVILDYSTWKKSFNHSYNLLHPLSLKLEENKKIFTEIVSFNDERFLKSCEEVKEDKEEDEKVSRNYNFCLPIVDEKLWNK